ncbi:uncharacterized protein LOC115988643 [Quercus lobata]|uniref:uncharacterized protein LOC115988643 n=1 Tax=Quercus lobata TaxID=97700 RepID=UPI001249416F|nr:uncharacterized protein LOC115988643 [Quercus lobata]
MAFKEFVVFFVLVCIASSLDGGMVKENDLNDFISRKQIEPRIKSIETKNGEIYDCVNIYEQPSLKHPSLKNHKFEMRPSNKVRELLAQIHSKKLPPSFRYAKIELDEKCPQGTIPIVRVTYNETPENESNLNKPQFSPLQSNGGLRSAGLLTKTTPDKMFHSNLASISVYNPQVGPHQYSSASVAVEAGDGPNFNQIQVGWIVNPDLYGDTRTHWFMQWTSNVRNITGCFNLNCGGFVQTNTQVPVGGAIDKVSVYSTEDQVILSFGLIQDNEGGKWWVVYNDNIDPIGYWPPTEFKELVEGADTLEWGGYVFTPPDDNTCPPMGSGHFDDGIYDRTCFMNQLQYTDSNYDLQSPTDVQTFMSDCYHEGDNSYKNDLQGYSFLFGGPLAPKKIVTT